MRFRLAIPLAIPARTSTSRIQIHQYYIDRAPYITAASRFGRMEGRVGWHCLSYRRQGRHAGRYSPLVTR